MRLRKKDNLPGVNLLDLKPVRTLDWQTAESDRVILLVPKFKNSFLVRWILPRLKSSHFKVKLDAYGSCVWIMQSQWQGEAFHHKYESIVLRVLDDRKVITDLGKLGLVEPRKTSFRKPSINRKG